jgi:hypothetical protein
MLLRGHPAFSCCARISGGYTAFINMANRSEGKSYTATKNLRVTEIAKLVRADIKAIMPKGFKVSVRSTYNTISATVTGVPAGFQYWTDEFLAHNDRCFFEGTRLTAEARVVIGALERIVGAYNYDNSDSQSDYFDTRFYARVGFSSDLTIADRKVRTVAVGEAFASPKAAAVNALENRKAELEAKLAHNHAEIARLSASMAARVIAIQFGLAEASLAGGVVLGNC